MDNLAGLAESLICGYIANMTRINARQKGARGELEVAAILQKVVTEVALICGLAAPTIRRNVEQVQVGGEDLVGVPWWSFEVKRVERVDLDKWWEQTCVQARRKAPGASSWDALAKGGWRRLGQAAQAREAARVGSGEVGSPVAPEGGSEAPRAGGRFDRDEAPTEAARAVGGLCISGEHAHKTSSSCAGGLPLPVWGGQLSVQRMEATSSSGPGRDWVSLPSGEARREGGPVGGPLAGLDGRGGFKGSPSDRVWMPVSGLPGGVQEVGRPATRDEGSAPVQGLPTAREPVLLWRVNRSPWQVRCFLDVVIAGNDKTRRILCDVCLDDWLPIFRAKLLEILARV